MRRDTVNLTSVRTLMALVSCLTLAALAPLATGSEDSPYPRYKPSSRAPEPIDIRTSSYGASRSAPDALDIGDRVPDFNLPRSGGGRVSLESARQQGPVAIIFYRGHW